MQKQLIDLMQRRRGMDTLVIRLTQIRNYRTIYFLSEIISSQISNFAPKCTVSCKSSISMSDWTEHYSDKRTAIASNRNRQHFQYDCTVLHTMYTHGMNTRGDRRRNRWLKWLLWQLFGLNVLNSSNPGQNVLPIMRIWCLLRCGEGRCNSCAEARWNYRLMHSQCSATKVSVLYANKNVISMYKSNCNSSQHIQNVS